MKAGALLLLLGFASLNVSAATLETLARSITPATGAQTHTIPWPDAGKIAGIKELSKLYPNAIEVTRSATIHLDKLGDAELFFSGNDSGFKTISATVPGVDKNTFTAVLKEQFSKAALIKLVRGECGNEGVISGTSIYEITLPGRKPFYAFAFTYVDNPSNSTFTDFDFSMNNEDNWRCLSHP